YKHNAGGMRVSKKLENAPVERSSKFAGKEKTRYMTCSYKYKCIVAIQNTKDPKDSQFNSSYIYFLRFEHQTISKPRKLCVDSCFNCSQLRIFPDFSSLICSCSTSACRDKRLNCCITTSCFWHLFNSNFLKKMH
uniref:Uncharacterized protein n=1 Tax=Laticauda laticaudata TaxID=8630 RepID=A0A8C5RXD1_LATLA